MKPILVVLVFHRACLAPNLHVYGFVVLRIQIGTMLY